MLDLKWIAKHAEEVKSGYQKKELAIDIDKVILLDKKRREVQLTVDHLRAQRNKISDRIANTKDEKKMALLEDARVIKEALEVAERQFAEVSHNLHDFEIQLHNIPDESVPSKITGDRVEKVYGEPKKFDFKPSDHLQLGIQLDIIDVDRATKVSGARFAYLKNEAVILELALVRWVMDKLVRKGFTPLIPPALVKDEAMFGTGFFPAEPNEYFKMAQDDLYLAGTAEVPLAAYHAKEILDEKELPKKYAGFSTCFRREAGSYGKDTRGIIRLHQFDKVEQFIYSHPSKSWEHFEELAKNSEEIFTELELPFRKITINAGELGAPNVKKYDFEAWIPSQNIYRELASCSHDTDFQARRLLIRFKDQNGKTDLVHTLNNTAIAVGRTIVAILENHQRKDGSIYIPSALQTYTGFSKIEKK